MHEERLTRSELACQHKRKARNLPHLPHPATPKNEGVWQSKNRGPVRGRDALPHLPHYISLTLRRINIKHTHTPLSLVLKSFGLFGVAGVAKCVGVALLLSFSLPHLPKNGVAGCGRVWQATRRCAFRRARARLASCPDQKVSPQILGVVRSSWTPR